MPFSLIRTVLVAVMGSVVGLTAGLLVDRLIVSSRAQGTDSATLASTHALTIQDVRSLSVLLSNRIDVADVCVTRIDGYLGGAEVAVLVRGQIDLGVDLDGAGFSAMDAVRRTATLRLPSPKVVSATIDHQRTRIVALTYSGLWQLNPQSGPAMAVVDRSLADTQRLLERLGSGPELNARSKQQVERVIQSWGQSLQWSIEVRWTDTVSSRRE